MGGKGSKIGALVAVSLLGLGSTQAFGAPSSEGGEALGGMDGILATQYGGVGSLDGAVFADSRSPGSGESADSRPSGKDGDKRDGKGGDKDGEAGSAAVVADKVKDKVKEKLSDKEGGSEAETLREKRMEKTQKDFDEIQKQREAILEEQEIDKLPEGVHPYNVEVSVPGANDAKKLIDEHLTLITKKDLPDLDGEQVEYLLRNVKGEVKQMMSTLGYFNSKTEISLVGDTYHVDVEAGPPTIVDNVAVIVTGPIDSDPKFGRFYHDIFEGWLLPIGSRFNQSDWATSKTHAHNVMTAIKYPLTKVVSSKALVDPVNNKVVLTMEMDSGDPVKFGKISISGYKRYPESVVSNLKQFDEGDEYNEYQILDYRQALEQDGHFGSATVVADFDNIKDNVVPVDVKVEELKSKKIDIGLEFDTRTKFGARVGFEDNNIFKKGYTGNVVALFNLYEQNLGLGITQPKSSKGYFWTAGVNYSNKTSQNVRSRTMHGFLSKARSFRGIDARIGIEYYLEDSFILNGPLLGFNYVTMVTAGWNQNRIETKERPYNGYFFSAKAATTIGSFLSTANAQRILLSGTWYHTPENRKLGTLVLRGSVGYVNSKKEGYDSLPQAVLFRTGGANSVRGYYQDGIGIYGVNESILGGKAMFNASVEYHFPITRTISLALFHDVGGVDNSFKNMKINHGTGMGVRWYMPFAPLSFDIAYGHQSKKWAWYVGLGTQFR